MVNAAKGGKNAGLDKLLGNIRPNTAATPAPVAPAAAAPTVASKPAPRMIVQEVRPVSKMGRPSSISTSGVDAIKISPKIPRALKRKVDVALAEELAGEFPTFNDFTTAAFRLLLESRKQPTDLDQ